MRFIFLLALLILFTSCSHTLEFRASHFATPVASSHPWQGLVSLVSAGNTKVTVINDITTNPPGRSRLAINESVSPSELLLVGHLGIDLSLGVLTGLDLFIENSLLGVRYQILNPGDQEDVWVGAIHGAFGEKNQSTVKSQSNNESSAESKIITAQAGVSLGYRFSEWIPYFSYIHELNQVSTKVKNPNGTFGPYDDEGKHSYYSFGVTSPPQRGFSYAIEYNMIDISWDRADRAYQNAIGARLGYRW